MVHSVGPAGSARPLATYDWALATNGHLTDDEKQRVRAGIRRGYLDIGVGLVRSLFRRARVDHPTAPDSRLARAAEEAAAEQGPALEGHGYRTWLVGAALARIDGVDVDPELLYVAGLLHDAGTLTELLGQDFTIRSAEVCLNVCQRANVEDPSIRTQLADAVVAHTTPGLDPATDPLGFYVQAGAMADLAGLRMWDLPRRYLRRAYEAHPAHGVHQVIPPIIRKEALDVPDGRFALLRRAGMDRMVTASPTRRYAR